MQAFITGHATHPDWRMATELALAQVEGRINQAGWAKEANLGVVYLSAEYAPHTSDIVALLEERTGVRDWAGTCGHAIVSTGVEYDSEPAIAIMLLDLPEDSFSVFSGATPPPPPGERTPSGAVAAQAALIHADPSTPDLAELIGDMAGKVGGGMMFGGSASGRAEPLVQIANQVLSGGLSGVVFSSEVDLRMRVTQGCRPLAGEHVISACQSNLIRTLDGRPALDVLLADLGVSEAVRSSNDGETLLRALPPETIALLPAGLFDAAERAVSARVAGGEISSAQAGALLAHLVRQEGPPILYDARDVFISGCVCATQS
jgi:small ligand-binding sensory domain FIST